MHIETLPTNREYNNTLAGENQLDMAMIADADENGPDKNMTNEQDMNT
jgi:hypothetical protein